MKNKLFLGLVAMMFSFTFATYAQGGPEGAPVDPVDGGGGIDPDDDPDDDGLPIDTAITWAAAVGVALGGFYIAKQRNTQKA